MGREAMEGADQQTYAPHPRSSPPGLHSLYGSDALQPRTCGAGGSKTGWSHRLTGSTSSISGSRDRSALSERLRLISHVGPAGNRGSRVGRVETQQSEWMLRYPEGHKSPTRSHSPEYPPAGHPESSARPHAPLRMASAAHCRLDVSSSTCHSASPIDRPDREHLLLALVDA